MVATTPDPRIVRAVYRSLLKASGNGRYPEVFGEYGRYATCLPSNPREVRKAVRDVFVATAKNTDEKHKATTKKKKPSSTDMFHALRVANESRSILYPDREHDLPKSGKLPIFDYGHSAAMMGEEVRFNFFEPRYLQLAKEATDPAGNGYFVLRSSNLVREVSVLLKITEHHVHDDDQVLVKCTAGPRIKVMEQEDVPVDFRHDTMFAKIQRDDLLSSDNNEKDNNDNDDNDDDDDDEDDYNNLIQLRPPPPLPMKRATKIVFVNDTVFDHVNNNNKGTTNNNSNNGGGDDNKKDDGAAASINPSTTTATNQALRTRCMELLSAVTTRQNILSMNVLPPLDPERFSFWLLRFVLAEADVPSRHRWMSCYSTKQRLEFVLDLLERHKSKKEEKDNNNNNDPKTQAQQQQQQQPSQE